MTEEEVFLTQSSFNGSTDRGNGLAKSVSSTNRQEDYENCQFNTEEATEGLFRFDHSDKSSIKKSRSAALKRDESKQEESVEEGYNHSRG